MSRGRQRHRFLRFAVHPDKRRWTLGGQDAIELRAVACWGIVKVPEAYRVATKERWSSLGWTIRIITDSFFGVFSSSSGTSNRREMEPFRWNVSVTPPMVSLGSSVSTSLSLSVPQLG